MPSAIVISAKNVIKLLIAVLTIAVSTVRLLTNLEELDLK